MKLLIIGAGGHGKCCYDIALRMNKFTKIDFVDEKSEAVFGKDIVGAPRDLKKLREDYDCAFVGIGNNQVRAKIMQEIKDLNYHIPVLIDPSAVVSSFSKIGEGSVVFANSVVEATGEVGKGCIISSLSVVHHDAIMEDYSLIYSQCTIRPYSKVESFTTIQSGTVVLGGK